MDSACVHREGRRREGSGGRGRRRGSGGALRSSGGGGRGGGGGGVKGGGGGGGASLSAPLTDGGLSHRHASGDPRSLSRTTCLYFESEKTHGEERERRREEKLKERGVNEEGFSKRGSRAWESDDTNQHSGALRQDCGHTH